MVTENVGVTKLNDKRTVFEYILSKTTENKLSYLPGKHFFS